MRSLDEPGGLEVSQAVHEGKTTVVWGSTPPGGADQGGSCQSWAWGHTLVQGPLGRDQATWPGKHPRFPNRQLWEGVGPSKPAFSWGPNIHILNENNFYFRIFTCVKTGNKVCEKQHPTHTPRAAGSSCGLSPTQPQERPQSHTSNLCITRPLFL